MHMFGHWSENSNNIFSLFYIILLFICIIILLLWVRRDNIFDKSKAGIHKYVFCLLMFTYLGNFHNIPNSI